MSGSGFIARRAARVFVVDAAGRLLLFNGHDPHNVADRFWLTPGGGIEDGESDAAAAARELAEETGLVVTPASLGEPVWRNTVEFSFEGRRHRQDQVFFLVRVAAWEVDTAGHNDVERRSVDGHGWFTVADLATLADPHYPAELPDLLGRFGAG